MYNVGMTNKDLATVLGVKTRAAFNIKQGSVALSVETAWRIEYLTKGAIAMSDWLTDTQMSKAGMVIR
jgi:plasmid maintenance system antidote protein VapI